MEEAKRFEWAWCVQGMPSKRRGQEHRVLVWVSQRGRHQKTGLTMWGQDVKDLVLPSPFKGRLKITPNLSVSMYSP